MADKAARAISNREMPSSIEAEQALLCSVMIDDNAPIAILNELDATDFYSKAHQDIFAAMTFVYNRNTPVDLITVVGQLEAEGKMEAVGGINYLSLLNSFVPSAANFRHYLNIIKNNAIQRKLIRAANGIIEKAYRPFDLENPEKEQSVLQFAEQQIYDIAQKNDTSSLIELSTTLNDSISEMEKLSKNPAALRGIPTQLVGLNKKINGLNKGDLIIIAARPGVGKTSLAMNFVEAAALNVSRKDKLTGKPLRYCSAVFSLEMPSIQIARRMLCSIGEIAMSRATSGNLSTSDWKKIFIAKNKLNDSKIFIDDSSLITPVEILSKCRRLKREHGLDLVMIDYLQLMNSGKKRSENRTQEVSDITKMLKVAAKELDVPIVLLSQLNREVEKRGKVGSRTPQLSDLRESGSIEQDADIVLFIDREYDPADEGGFSKNLCKLIIAKNRNGETGIVNMLWQGEFVRFVESDSKEAENHFSPPIPPPNAVNVSQVIEDIPEVAAAVDQAKGSIDDDDDSPFED